MTSKIFVLMRQDVDEMGDVPEKFFTNKELADFWCDNLNEQVENYRVESGEYEDDEDVGIFYYVEEQEIETTKNVKKLFDIDSDVEPVQIEGIVGSNIFSIFNR